jgi:hypothetical protein
LKGVPLGSALFKRQMITFPQQKCLASGPNGVYLLTVNGSIDCTNPQSVAQISECPGANTVEARQKRERDYRWGCAHPNGKAASLTAAQAGCPPDIWGGAK